MAYYVLSNLLYITLSFIQGSLMAFMPLFYSQVLLINYCQIGLLLAIVPFVQMVACPFWIQIVDRCPRWHGSLMGMLAMIGGLSISFICFLPEWINIKDSSQLLVMALVSVCSFGFAFTISPLPILVDGAVAKLLDNQLVFHGNQRLYGTASSILQILVVGIVISRYDFQIAFGIYFVGLMAFVSLSMVVHMIITSKEASHDEQTLLSSSMPNYSSFAQSVLSRDTGLLPGTILCIAIDIQAEANETLETSGALPSLGLALSSIPTAGLSLSALGTIHRRDQWPEKRILMAMLVYTFMISVFLYGLAHAMINQFSFLLLTDLGIGPLFLGFTRSIGSLVEVLTFWFSRQLLDKFSINFLMIMAYLAFIFHTVIYTCLNAYDPKTTVIVFMLQILNGFAHALIWATAMTEIDSFFPVHQQLIARGIFAALFYGFGCTIGCLAGGLVYGFYGPVKLFQIAAFMGSVSLVVFLTGRRTNT